jgi:hypothetical protein
MSQITDPSAGNLTLRGNTGGYVKYVNNNFDILGAGLISTVGNPLTGTITINASATIPSTVTCDSGLATPAVNILQVLGGVGVSTSGAGNIVTINIAKGTNGQVLIGQGATSNAVWATVGTSNGVTSTIGAGTLSIGGISASTSQIGVVILASDAETIAGTDSSKVIVPTSLKAKLGLQTIHALPIGTSDTVALGWLAVGATGETLMGATGADCGWTGSPSFSGSVTAGTGLTVTLGDAVVTNGSIDVGVISADAIGSEVTFKKSRAVGTPVILSGDALGTISFNGHDGTSYHEASVISSTSSGTIGTGRIPSNLAFWTAPDTVGGATKRLEIKSTGEVVIETPDSGIALTVGGTTAATTFDTNVAAAAVTLTGTTLAADGTDADININITAKGAGKVTIDDLQLTTDLAVTEGGTGVSTLLDHGLLVGSGTAAVDVLAVGADGTILIGNTTADPSWSASPIVTTMYATTFDTNVAAAAVTISGTTLAADGSDADININITAKGAGKVIIDDLQLTTDLAVTEGGTGASTLTDHGVLIGNGTSAVTATAEGASGVILTGVTGAVPTWTTATYPATVAIGDVLVASAANIIGVVAGAATSGYVLTANGAGTAPTFQATAAAGIVTLAGDTGTATGSTVTIAGGSNITTSAATATLTVDLDNSITLSGDVTALNLKTSTAATNLTLNGNTITSDGSDTDVDIHLVAKGIGGLTFDGIATGYSDSQWHLRQEEVQTANATPTALVTIPLVEGEMLTINATINGFQSDFTDACGATCVMTAYRPTGGNVTQIGEEIININSTSTATISADVVIGSQSMIIYATGVAAETWNWVSTHQYMFTKTNA